MESFDRSKLILFVLLWPEFESPATNKSHFHRLLKAKSENKFPNKVISVVKYKSMQSNR